MCDELLRYLRGGTSGHVIDMRGRRIGERMPIEIGRQFSVSGVACHEAHGLRVITVRERDLQPRCQRKRCADAGYDLDRYSLGLKCRNFLTGAPENQRVAGFQAVRTGSSLISVRTTTRLCPCFPHCHRWACLNAATAEGGCRRAILHNRDACTQH